MKTNLITTLRKHQFLFEELVKRDFKQKYKRTVLGMGWSILSPLLTLLVMRIVFTHFFGRTMEHYTTYLFAGNLMYSYFRESTRGGLGALTSNAHIFSRINVPKYLFLFSKNISSLINFLLTLVVFFIFAAFDGVTFTWKFLLLIYPVCGLLVFNLGVGLILSAMQVFFRDTVHLYDIFLMLLMYMSAIFYTVDTYPVHLQQLFLLNPVYTYITYMRSIVLDGVIPSFGFHMLLFGYAAAAMLIGGLIYKKKNQRFLYYL